jgi:hypothetical protein
MALIKRFRWKALSGEIISIPPKELGSGIRYASAVRFSASAGHSPAPALVLFSCSLEMGFLSCSPPLQVRC